jgi:hypothetical protein
MVVTLSLWLSLDWLWHSPVAVFGLVVTHTPLWMWLSLDWLWHCPVVVIGLVVTLSCGCHWTALWHCPCGCLWTGCDPGLSLWLYLPLDWLWHCPCGCLWTGSVNQWLWPWTTGCDTKSPSPDNLGLHSYHGYTDPGQTIGPILNLKTALRRYSILATKLVQVV